MAFTPGDGAVGGLPVLPSQPQPSNQLLALLQRLQSQPVTQPGIYKGLAPGGIHYFGPGGSGVIPEPHADPLEQLLQRLQAQRVAQAAPHNPAEQIHHMLPPGPHSDFLHLLQHPAVQRLLGRRIESRSSMAAHAALKAIAAHHANDPRLVGY